MSIKLDFLGGFGFPVMNRKIARRVFSSVWVTLNKKLTVVAKIYLQGGERPVHRRQVLGDSP